MKNLHRNFFAFIVLLTCFALLAAYPATAFANAPKEVKLSYDASSQTLQATITHSPISSGHYVAKVEVKKNGQPAPVEEFKGQSSETFIYSVKVPAAPGDILEVKASCSRFGSKTERLKVEPTAAK